MAKWCLYKLIISDLNNSAIQYRLHPWLKNIHTIKTLFLNNFRLNRHVTRFLDSYFIEHLLLFPVGMSRTIWFLLNIHGVIPIRKRLPGVIITIACILKLVPKFSTSWGIHHRGIKTSQWVYQLPCVFTIGLVKPGSYFVPKDSFYNFFKLCTTFTGTIIHKVEYYWLL